MTLLSLMARWPIVGREREVALVGEALRDPAWSGVVIGGPTGAGKSRLAQECQALAEASGFGALWVTATRAAREIPLGALAGVLPRVATNSSATTSDALRIAVDNLVSSVGERPLLLIVDDAHLLDDASATVVHQLTAHSGSFVVVTIRDGERSPDAIASLWKDGLAARIDVPALTEDDLEHLVQVVLGGAVSVALTHELWRTSAGNALYLRELLLAGVDSGRIARDGDVWRLRGPVSASSRLVALVAERIGSLRGAELEGLQLVVYGEPIGATLVESLTAPDAVDAMQRRGLLVTERNGRREELRLAHPLYGEVLREQMPPSTVRRVCGRLADAVERLGNRRYDDVARVANWSLHDPARHDPVALLAAARLAQSAADLPVAERLAVAACDAGGGWAALELRAEVATDLGRHEQAELLFADATTLARTDEERALVAMGRSTNLFAGLGRVEDAIETSEHALGQVTEDVWRAELIAHRAMFELLRGRPVTAMAAVADLLDMRQGRAFAEAAMAAVPALVVTGRFDDAMRLADEAFVAHLDLGDSISIAHPAVHMVAKVFALREAGLAEEARSLGEFGYRSAIEMRSTLGEAYFALQYAGVLLLIGHVRAAAQMADEAASLFGDLALPGRRRWGLALTAHCAAVAGDLVLSDRLLLEVDAITVMPERLMDAEIERARAWNAAAHGELTRALGCLRDGIDLADGQGALGLELGLVHDLARLGDVRTATELVGRCGGVHGPLATSRREHIAAASAHDGTALDAVAEKFADAKILLFAAEAAADATRAHERAGSKRAALASQRRSSELAEQCEGARTPALAMSTSTPLTPREREVAALAAAGLGNRAIAERLFVSLRTVENHLQRIYDKLGVPGRQELSAALGRRAAGESR